MHERRPIGSTSTNTQLHSRLSGEMTKRRQLGLLALFLFLVTSDSEPDALERVNTRFRATDMLQTLSETIEAGYHNKREIARNCTCAHHACSHSLDTFQSCSNRVGSMGVCGDTCTTRKVRNRHRAKQPAFDKHALQISLEHGYITTPPNVDPLNLAPLIAEESCIYQVI